MSNVSLGDEYTRGLVRGFATMVGVYIAIRLIMWADDGNVLGHPAPEPAREPVGVEAVDVTDEDDADEGGDE